MSQPGAGATASTSNLESTITRLLVATKQLLEGLASWSRRELDEEEISQIYVKLGNDFNVACAAFAREGITMNELMAVPSDLRICLESCLSNPPSQATLERHLPEVRQIIIGLLHGLRDKQRQYREGVAARRAREANGKGKNPAPPPAGSNGPPLTPNSAGRSREDLRRFVSQAQATAVPEDAATRRSSNRSVGSDAGSSAGSHDPRLSAALSSRLSAGGAGPSRSGSMRESSRSSRSTFDPQDAFAPPAAGPTAPHMPRTNSAASLESVRSVASTSAAPAPRPPPTDRPRMVSPPPPSRHRDDSIPAVPRTPTMDTFGSVLSAPPSVPSTVIRPPSVVSNASSVAEDPHAQQAQAASLEALKASDHLSRRASKRYSAYAIQKMTSPSPGSTSPSAGGGMSSPGGERANRARAGEPLYRAGSGSSAGRELAGVDAPRRSKSEHSRHGRTGSRAAGGGGGAPPIPPIPRSYSSQADLRSGAGGQASPILEEEDDDESASPAMSARSPPSFPPPPLPGALPRSGSSRSLHPGSAAGQAQPQPRAPSPALPPLPHDDRPSLPPSPTSPPSEPQYPCSIFLQIGRDVKKARLAGPPDIQSLRQLFVERFGYNPGLSGWPDVYLRDTDAGVHYELEDMSEVRAGSVLSLNVDTVEQVKQHIDQGMSTLAQDIKELRATVTAMRRLSISASSATLALPLLSPPGEGGASPTLRGAPSEKQYEQAAQKVLAMRKLHSTPNLAAVTGEDEAVPPTAVDLVTAPTSPQPAEAEKEAVSTIATAPSVEPFSPTAAVAPIVDTLKSQHAEVQNLRREIGVLRQVYADFTSSTKEMFASVRVQTSHVQHLAQSKLSTDRAFVEAGTAKLEAESTDLVLQVDTLQDTIEAFRVDTLRGVKPRPQQLSETANALRKATAAREKLAQWLADAKPTWSQMWSVELSKILAEQKGVEEHATLLAELEQDLSEVAGVFSNIQAVAKQLKGPAGGSGLGAPRRELNSIGGAVDDAKGGLDTVLLEVKALQPDPSRRLEAIARAERQRELELASRTDEFAEELGDFVGKGRLKKSGGIEETERLRQARSEATLKQMFQQ
ncbi:Bud site selection protein 6 [Rhodotorula kratochvilovae]